MKRRSITRRGTNLAELLVTMSACAVILTMSASLIHRAMQASSKARLQHSVERNALRLAQQFRRDVNSATEATTDSLPEGSLIRLQLPDNRAAEYRQVSGTVQRVLLNEDTVLAREFFVFPEGNVLVARSEPSDSVSLSARFEEPATTEVSPAPLSAHAVPLRLNVVAALRSHMALGTVIDSEDPPNEND
jgi:hypothetical protein